MAGFKTLAENPLVIRAFRVGFRPGGFRMGVWLSLLVLLMVIVMVAHFTNRHSAIETCQWVVNSLLGFTALTFVAGGLQRTLTAFANERERGTFDFLHLSTMRPSSMILGFLFAGQLPGYLLLLFTLPVMVICSIIAEFRVMYLFAMVGMGVFFVGVFSVFYILVGFWMRRISDLRSGAVFLTILLVLIVGSMAMAGQKTSTLGPPGFIATLCVWPVFVLLYLRLTGVDDPSRFMSDIGFFDVPMVPEFHAILFLTPVTVIAFLALRRSIRHRERRPLSNTLGFALVTWIQLYLTGLFWGGDLMCTSEKITILAVISFLFLFFFIVNRGVRSVPATARVAAHLGGDRAKMVIDPEAPPYVLVGVLSVTTAIFLWVQTLSGTFMERTFEISILAFLSLSVFMPLYFLLAQWLRWRGYSTWWMAMLQGLLVWLPFLLYVAPFLPKGESLEGIARSMSVVSPLVQAWTLSGSASAAIDLERYADCTTERIATMGFMALFVIGTIAMSFLHAGELKRIAGLVAPKPDETDDVQSTSDDA